MILLRSIFWWLAGVAVCAVAAGPVRVWAGGPNFLVVVADDMRADAVRAHGGVGARTPVLDGLVGDGFSFRSAYCLGLTTPCRGQPRRCARPGLT